MAFTEKQLVALLLLICLHAYYLRRCLQRSFIRGAEKLFLVFVLVVFPLIGPVIYIFYERKLLHDEQRKWRARGESCLARKLMTYRRR